MTNSKTKTNVLIMEPINASKTIILAIKISKYNYVIAIQSIFYNDFIFKHLLILTFKSNFKGLGRVTENFVIICKRQPNYFEDFFSHIQYLKSDHH